MIDLDALAQANKVVWRKMDDIHDPVMAGIATGTVMLMITEQIRHLKIEDKVSFILASGIDHGEAVAQMLEALA